jgi:hypothetical protein
LGKLKSAKEILEDLGFNKEAPSSTQLAFLRFLKKEIKTHPEKNPPPSEPQQLEFDLEGNRLKSGSS